jgi:addiction module HigA family antidote
MKNKKIPPIHPGEILDLEFLKPMGLSQNKLALALGVSPRRINEIVLGKRRITANTALRLAKYFNMTPQFWLGLQMDYDLDVEQDQSSDEFEIEFNTYRKNWDQSFKTMAINRDDKLLD